MRQSGIVVSGQAVRTVYRWPLTFVGEKTQVCPSTDKKSCAYYFDSRSIIGASI